MSDSIDKLFNQISAKEQSVLLNELHRIAKRFMFCEQENHTLQATALVNEAYLKLSSKALMLENKQHFVAIAARQMRHILVDHARQKLSLKRNKNTIDMTIADVPSEQASTLELIYLDQLLEELKSFDERAAMVYELRLFSGLSNLEIAQVLEISVATVERDAKAAKAWLTIELREILKA